MAIIVLLVYFVLLTAIVLARSEPKERAVFAGSIAASIFVSPAIGAHVALLPYSAYDDEFLYLSVQIALAFSPAPAIVLATLILLMMSGDAKVQVSLSWWGWSTLLALPVGVCGLYHWFIVSLAGDVWGLGGRVAGV